MIIEMFIAPLHLSLCQVYGWGTLKINADTSFILRKLVDMQKKHQWQHFPFQHQLNTHLLWWNTHTSCWQHKHTFCLTKIRQDLKQKIERVISFVCACFFTSALYFHMCLCLQFYSILDGDEDMLFLHVDNPGGIRQIHKPANGTF